MMTGLSSSGVDLVSTMLLKEAQPVGSVVLNLPLGPASLAPSRWRNESALWSRWRPRSLRATVVGSGAATTFGSVCLAWCPDSTWVPTGNSSDYMRAAALRPSVTMRLHESKVLSIPSDSATKWYYCDGLRDISNHGCLIAVVASPPGGYTGACGVTVTLDWSVQFEGVEMPGESAAIADTIMPDSGWTNLFTTSDSSFDSTILTFKMHSGGNMAPFSAAREDHVYVPSPGTRVMYYDRTGKLLAGKYFVKLRFTTPGLGLVATRQDAADYISSADASKLLTYKLAGPVSTPSVLRFIGSPVHVSSLSAGVAPSMACVEAFFRSATEIRGETCVTTWQSSEDWTLVQSYFNGFRKRESESGLEVSSDGEFVCVSGEGQTSTA